MASILVENLVLRWVCVNVRTLSAGQLVLVSSGGSNMLLVDAGCEVRSSARRSVSTGLDEQRYMRKHPDICLYVLYRAA